MSNLSFDRNLWPWVYALFDYTVCSTKSVGEYICKDMQVRYLTSRSASSSEESATKHAFARRVWHVQSLCTVGTGADLGSAKG